MIGPNATHRRARLPWLVLALGLMHAVLYAAVTPPWQAPDEPRHFLYTRLMLDLRRLPAEADWAADRPLQEDLYRSLSEHAYWQTRSRLPDPGGDPSESVRRSGLRPALNHPPLPYAIGAVALLPLQGVTLLTQMYALRALGALFGVVAVGVAFTLGELVCPSDRLPAWGAALFVATLPMQSFIAGSVNNDPVVQAFASLAVLALARLLAGDRTWRPVAWFGLCSTAALASKGTALYLLPLGVSLVPLMWPSRFAFVQRDRRRVGWGAVLLATAALAAAGIVAMAGGPAFLSSMQRSGYNLLLTFASFWANFGWMNVPLDAGWYLVPASMSVAGAAGWIVLGLGRGSNSAVWTLCTLASACILVQAVLVAVVRQEPAQGRYLFPALAPVAVCLSVGLLHWAPAGARRLALLGLFVAWTAFDLVALFGYVLPRFYA